MAVGRGEELGIADFLLSPRRDLRGLDTPSEASRLLLLITVVGIGIWAWPISEGMVFVWLALVLLVSTPILSVGWYMLSLFGQSRESRDLTPAVSRGSNDSPDDQNP